MTEKQITMEQLEETVQRTDEQLDIMEWKMDNVEKQMAEPIDQDVCIVNLLKSVSEVRSDYQQLRRELVEVQALQRELSTRLRTQLRLVHGKFARLRQRIAAASPPR
ncbi:uncharacterized protein LOC126775732 [Nymphalis io]|uniref:Uncharacterized protein LOC113404585 n=1 Tax=Vanessa tameamea TaxID=334116 RepID=A0A8B8IVW8_VANTA|nr:uncharacterized protein LOC113404585 [Vanessa tameamea]XP_046964061.1 uncharacterized protein LOC124532966 [Vanessa cardui]XP_047538393.1 uncharacterized protein LOC125071984 [Vanessa atalanta]XP_050353789.1 uncharacterized protein LOC126775732 [Nymphalis io]